MGGDPSNWPVVITLPEVLATALILGGLVWHIDHWLLREEIKRLHARLRECLDATL
jgi:hypothetical protein